MLKKTLGSEPLGLNPFLVVNSSYTLPAIDILLRVLVIVIFPSIVSFSCIPYVLMALILLVICDSFYCARQ